MLKPKKRWINKQLNEEIANTISKEYKINSVFAQLLVNRNLTDNEQVTRFLNIDKSYFYDPFLLSDMEKAVDRIKLAIKNDEKILIYGDYDADGVTSTVVLYKTLKKLNGNFAYYIPNRFTEGYGLNKEAIIQAAKKGIKIIITVDTGISAIEEADLAEKLGIDLIITDHHEPKEILPNAYAVINPKKKSEKYPFNSLAGVGVAFKLAHALLGELPEDLLDIVAIGTISDLVPLIDENRIIATIGLEQMKSTQNIGLKVLLEKTGLIKNDIKSHHVGYIIGPRVNAGGRMDSASNAVKLFITNDEEEAKEIVSSLERTNQERQTLVDKITKEAERLIEDEGFQNDKVIVVAREDWNIGVIGIVASRIVEKYYRPTIILSIDKEAKTAKGSARSIEGFDINSALTKTEDILINFGGHTQAAGLSMSEDKIDNLRLRLNEIANSLLKEEDFIPIEKVDVVCNIDDISINLIEDINKMEPFGIGNPSPKFIIDNAEIAKIIAMGNNKEHLKLNLKSGKNKYLDGLFFKQGELYKDIAYYSKLKMIGELAINEWQGQKKPQIIIKDVDISEPQVFDWRKGSYENLIKTLFLEKTAFLINKKIDIINYCGEDCNYINYKNEDHKLYDYENIVLFHLPSRIEELIEILNKFEKPERVYCLFKHDDGADLASYIKRENYEKVYITIKNNEKLREVVKAEQYFSSLDLNPKNFHYILKVFVELEFISIKENKIIVNSISGKKELKESKLYSSLLSKNETINFLLNSSHLMLRKWILDNI